MIQRPKHRGKTWRLAATASIALSLLVSSASAQTYQISGGAIGAEQVERGQEAYLENCSGCHGVELQSVDSNTPSLKGSVFKYGWVGKPLSEKYTKIVTTMPPGMAGELPNETYADIMAFIIASNGVEAVADGALPADAEQLENVVIEAN